MKQRTHIEDLPTPEKELAAEELKEIEGGFGGGWGGSRPGNEYVTLKYPSDGDDDIYETE